MDGISKCPGVGVRGTGFVLAEGQGAGTGVLEVGAAAGPDEQTFFAHGFRWFASCCRYQRCCLGGRKGILGSPSRGSVSLYMAWNRKKTKYTLPLFLMKVGHI